jgi:wyosine [tRNA(Phe)-imidazoG37] synthetase (radical SAM superfamily)
MSDKIFKKIIDEISNEKGIKCIVLHLQNEPLLDNDIFQKIQLIKKIVKGNIITFFVTNGSLFSDEKISELEHSELDELIVSLDASREETYNKIRQGLDYKKVLNNIQKIAKTISKR